MLHWPAAMAALIAISLPATWFHAALPTPGEVPARGSLAGQLLIASPKMGDPRFQETVILMVRHNQDGAFGLVINRPLGERPLASVLAILGEKEDAVSGTVRVFAGGPVQPQLGFVVHSPDYRRAETVDVDGRVAVTSSAEILRDIGRDKGPKKSFIAFGYAGWGPGQLEGELEAGAWFVTPEEPDLVFDEDRNKVWERAMARRTRDL
jgi:putative transcriptional regulator